MLPDSSASRTSSVFAGDRDVRGARGGARPGGSGACRVVRLAGFALDVEADAPIVAQELRLRGTELLTAFAAAPGGVGVRELRVHVRRAGPRV